MKKFLSVVLALAMTFSLVVVGASAKDFTDKDKVTKTEAVGVMSGMGIISGYTDGSFKPQGNITRGAAAKIICIASLGTKTAGVLTCDTAPFKDVAKDSTFAPYISYCVNTGIIDGYSDGSFQPSKNVSGFAFAKMLLNALKIKGTYTGANWSVNVAQAAIKANLFNGIEDSVSYSNPATRENACQMTFNAMNYTAAGTSSKYVVKDTNNKVLYSGTDALTALVIKQANASSTMTLENTNEGSLGATMFGLTKGTTTDDFGRESVVYTNGKTGTALVTYATFAPKAVKTYTTATTNGKVRSDLGYTTVAKDISLTVITDGVKANAVTVAKGDSTVIGGQGTLVEVYQTGTDAFTAVVVNTYVKKLAAGDIHAATAATSTADAAAAYITLESGKNYETSAFKAGDVVLYTKNASKIVNVVKADSFTGKVTAVGANNAYVRVDGAQKYTAAHTASAIGTAPLVVNDTTKTFYTDAYGNIVLAENGQTATVATDYVYVIDTAAKAAVAGEGGNLFESGSTTAAVAQAKVIDVKTGEISVKNIGVVKGTDNNYYYATKQGAASANAVTNESKAPTFSAAGIYKYATLTDGSIVLDNTATTTEAVKVLKDRASVNVTGKVANSATKLTVVEYTTGTNNAIVSATASTVTGIANFPATEQTYTAVVDLDSANPALVSNILVVKAKAAATAAANYVVYKGVGETDATGTFYDFYANGEVVSYHVATADVNAVAAKLTADNVYDVTLTDGKIANADAVSTAKTPVATGALTVVDNSYAIVNGSICYFAAGYKVVDATNNYAAGKLEVSSTATAAVYGADAAHAAFIVITAK